MDSWSAAAQNFRLKEVYLWAVAFGSSRTGYFLTIRGETSLCNGGELRIRRRWLVQKLQRNATIRGQNAPISRTVNIDT
jgi:hypothetical protein